MLKRRKSFEHRPLHVRSIDQWVDRCRHFSRMCFSQQIFVFLFYSLWSVPSHVCSALTIRKSVQNDFCENYERTTNESNSHWMHVSAAAAAVAVYVFVVFSSSAAHLFVCVFPAIWLKWPIDSYSSCIRERMDFYYVIRSTGTVRLLRSPRAKFFM